MIRYNTIMADRLRQIDADWYQASFDALYPIIYAHRTIEAARREAEFSIEQTKLCAADSVLDLCCGNGRHIAHLLRHTDNVVGLDLSTHLLALARASLGGQPRLVRADMRRLPFDAAFDVVMNYFTSFGYFLDEEQNLAVVRDVARALKPGGRFFLDYINHNWAQEHVEPESRRHHNGYEIREDRWIDQERLRVNKTTTIFENGREIGSLGESVKLYTLDEMTRLLANGGLRVDRAFGDYSGDECCDPSKPRMIIVGRKA
jgi:SAM-dependent methyltransferase